MVEKKPLAGERRGLLLVGGLVAALAAALWWARLGGQPGHTAAVFWNGERVWSFALGEYQEPEVVSMRELGFDVPVSFEVREGEIRFVEVDCPDKLCEGFGFIGRPNETAVCMPNRVSVSILP